MKINVPLLFLVVFLIITYSVALQKGLTPENILIAFLVGTGLSQFMGGMGHIFSPTRVAKSIGWPASPRFQYEVGIANIVVGLLCISTIYFRDNWILASIVASAIWGWGNAIGHILSWYYDDNTKGGNIGLMLYLDIFIPLISIILYIIYKR